MLSSASRGPLVLAPLLGLLVIGCGRVVFEDDDIETSTDSPSSSHASTSGGPDVASGAGGANEEATSAITTGSGGGGEGGGNGRPLGPADPELACGELAWLGEPLRHDLHSETFAPSALHIQSVGDDGGPLGATIPFVATYPERDGDLITHNARFMRLGHAWAPASAAVDPDGAYLDFHGVHEWFSRTEDPTPVGAGRGGGAAYVVHDAGGSGLREVVTGGGVPLPSDVEGVRRFAWNDVGRYALIHGAARWPELILVDSDQPSATLAVDLAACADRSVPVDVAASGDGFVIAAASAPTDGGCDAAAAASAPTTVVLTRIDASGEVVARASRDAGGVVTAIDLHTFPEDEEVFLAVQRELEDEVLMVGLEPDLSEAVQREMPLGTGRSFTLTNRGENELLLVDTGPRDGVTSPVRLRLFTRSIVPMMETQPLPTDALDPVAKPSVIVRDDLDRFAVATFDRVADGHFALAVLRARCLGESP